MNIRFKPLGVWPRAETLPRKRAPFKSNYNGTLQLLEKELRHLGADDAELQVEMKLSDIAIHGWPKANARATGPRVILSFTANRLAGAPVRVFPCDAFLHWEGNLRAIALALEALRKVDRYGVTTTGEQYAGFKQIAPTSSTTLSAEGAAIELFNFSSVSTKGVLADAAIAKDAVRIAVAKTHPDKWDGDRSKYDRVDAARSVLSSHHGVSL